MLLLPGKTTFKMSKSLGKNIRKFISTFYVLMHNFIKKWTFCGLRKKSIKMKMFILLLNFIIFT
jgi:hypothetical protein